MECGCVYVLQRDQDQVNVVFNYKNLRSPFFLVVSTFCSVTRRRKRAKIFEANKRHACMITSTVGIYVLKYLPKLLCLFKLYLKKLLFTTVLSNGK